MRGRLVVVSGTGTQIGKTHFAEALLLAWCRAAGRVVGLKPVESGVNALDASDAARLAGASSFHVKQFGVALRPALSPHLAARDEGTVLSLNRLASAIDELRGQTDAVVVELAGGLFTPLTDTTLNADWAVTLRADCVLLVAPDRLGVLHDVLACGRAARVSNLRLGGIVLNHPERADQSTGRNADELRRLADAPVVATLPRASADEISRLRAICDLIDRLR